MAALPYMPLYIADYLADTAHLSTLENGAYLMLIMTYWQTGKPLPDDDKKLARITRISPQEWDEIKDIIKEFFEASEGILIHKRIENELSKVYEKSEKAKYAVSVALKNKQNKHDCNTDDKQTFNERSTDEEQTFNHTDTDTDTFINTNRINKSEPSAEAFEVVEILCTLHNQHIDSKYNPLPAQKSAWARDVDKLNRIDKRDWDDIKRVVVWVKQPGCFWAPNIMSGKKLREKFPTLLAQMGQTKPQLKLHQRTAMLEMAEA